MSAAQPDASHRSFGQARWGKRLCLYVGARAEAQNHIHCLSLDTETGHLSLMAPPCPADNPSFVALHPDGGTLYAANELGQTRDQDCGLVSSFRVDRETGGLAPLNCQASGGAAPCHLTVAPEGRRLFVSNYWGESFATFAVAADGSIGPRLALIQRGSGSHIHWTSLDSTGGGLIVTDLGRDAILRYGLDSGGVPTAEKCVVQPFPPGTGPRHAVPLGGGARFAVASELGSTVTVLHYEPGDGSMRLGPVLSTLPPAWSGENTVAEIARTPDERFLYVSNRGHDSIAVFRHDRSAGALATVGFCPTLGSWPRHFAIDPSGRLLVVANQRSDTVVAFWVDLGTGMLRPTGSDYIVPAPTCIAFVPPR